MKLLSPLPIEECRAVLREQIGARHSLLRAMFFRRTTSRVVGKICGEEVVLESSSHGSCYRFVGRLRDSPNGSELEGEWRDPFGSKIHGSPHDEIVVLRFLAEWARFKKVPDRSKTDSTKTREG